MPLEVGTKSTGWFSGFRSRTKSNVAHVMCKYRVGGMSVNSIQKRQHDTFIFLILRVGTYSVGQMRFHC